MKLTVWNKAIVKADGTLQAVVYDDASWEFAHFNGTTRILYVTHPTGRAVIPWEMVAMILEQPEPGDAKAH